MDEDKLQAPIAEGMNYKFELPYHESYRSAVVDAEHLLRLAALWGDDELSDLLFLEVLPRLQTALRNKNQKIIEELWHRTEWFFRHLLIKQQIASGMPIDLIFIGGSIIYEFDVFGRATWQQYYSHHDPLNMGASADKTSRIIWRLNNCDLEKINPSVAVVMFCAVGLIRLYFLKQEKKEINEDSFIEALGQLNINAVNLLREKLPNTQILIVGTIPSWEKECKFRDQMRHINKMASTIANGKDIHYLDIDKHFLDKNGCFSEKLTYDNIHLTTDGFKVFARAIQPKLSELFERKQNEENTIAISYPDTG